MLKSLSETFLAFVRLGIGNTATVSLSNSIDWNAIEALAKQHGLLGVLVDGVEKLPQNKRPPQLMWLRWIGEVMQGYESQYVLYRKAVADLASWYHAHGYRMMVLKGMACGLDWPKPEHRPYGDIDIYLFGQQSDADAEMVSGFRIQDPSFKIDNSHHHHTVFNWQGFTVENHYDFVNVHHQKSNVELEKIFKELAFQDVSSILPHLSNIDLPSPNLHALFLIKHLASHFAADRITLRHVLDWGFFVKKQGEKVDWDWLLVELKRFGMLKLFDVVNTICVEDLGFDKGCWSKVDSWGVDANLKQRVLDDIISPEFSEKTPKHVWKRIPYRYRRWKSNEWKHELCYNESMSSSFWSGVKNHLLKPASI